MSRLGSLSADMIRRGTVPAELLFGAAAPTRPVLSLPVAVPRPPVASPEPPPPPPAVQALVVNVVTEHGAPRRKAMTLRVSPEQHARLRLTSLCLGRTAQSLMVEALTLYLSRLARPDIGV